MQSFGSRFLFRYRDITGIDVFNGIHFTKPCALGIPVAQITLDNFFVDMIEAHGAKRADRHTRTAADAKVIVNLDPARASLREIAPAGQAFRQGASWHCWHETGI